MFFWLTSQTYVAKVKQINDLFKVEHMLKSILLLSLIFSQFAFSQTVAPFNF